MSFLTSRLFWLDTIERSVKTFAQAAVAVVSADGLGLLTVSWTDVASVAGLAAVVSILTSIASGGTGNTDSASLVVETRELK